MKMYVANCTQQAQDFIYRTVAAAGTRTQRIEIGAQVKLAGDLTREDIDYIIRQHAKYGMVSAAELSSRVNRRKFMGVCYAVDKPVTIEHITLAVHLNTEVLVERGRDIRKEAAVAVNNSMEEQTPGSLTALELSVTEDRKDGADPDISEGTRVTRRLDDNGQPATREAVANAARPKRRRGNN